MGNIAVRIVMGNIAVRIVRTCYLRQTVDKA